LGPLPDRSIFDKTLPTTWDAITSIDMNTGHDPVDPTYANVTHHAKWVIPWYVHGTMPAWHSRLLR
jgi:hypothetical protein